MDVILQSRAVKFLGMLFDKKNPNTSIVKTGPQKADLKSFCVSNPLERSSPEEQGLSSEQLNGFLKELYDNGEVYPHCVMVIRNSKVISECSYAPYSLKYMHVTHSLCKSITGIAICMLIDEGKLRFDDNIMKFFEEHLSLISMLFPVKTTVRRLLTMTSNVVFNEIGVVTDTDWINSFLESGVRSQNEEFNYNSMNTFMLSAIVWKVTGQRLDEYLAPRLFEPLGIKDWYWEKAPDGNCKGGWGLYMHLEDLAKIGCLLLNKGVWNGRRILSEQIVDDMTKTHAKAPSADGDYDYGYQMWIGRKGTNAEGSFVFNGMLGQNIICFPEKNMLIACFAGNNSLFQQNSFFKIANRTFGADFKPEQSLPEDARAERELRETENRFADMNSAPKPVKPTFTEKILSIFGIKKAKKANIPEVWSRLNGSYYSFPSDYTASVGLMPLFLQTLQNNFSEGLTGMKFETDADSLKLVFYEGPFSYVIEPGINYCKTAKLTFKGEPYLVASKAEFVNDEDGNPVLKLELSFLETSNSRKIKIYFNGSGDRIKVKFSENPGVDCILEGIEAAVGDLRSNVLVDMLFSITDPDYLIYKMNSVFEPEFKGTLNSEKK